MCIRDRTRTQLDHVLTDGSTSLVYYQEQVDQVNPLASDSDLTLPGWDASYTREELKQVVACLLYTSRTGEPERPEPGSPGGYDQGYRHDGCK